MKCVFMTVILLLCATNSMAQEMDVEVGSSMEVEMSACTDGTVAGAGCIDLNTHPTIAMTGEVLTLLLEQDIKKAPLFCDQSNKQCLAPIASYFKKKGQDYERRSITLIGDDDLTVQSSTEAKFIMGDGKNKNQYAFIFEYKRHAINKPWKITEIRLSEMEPMASDGASEGVLMDAVGE